MYYIIYIIGIVLFLLNGIGLSNLSSFRDGITAILVIVPCFLMLFGTKSLKAFGESILFPLGKRNYSLRQCKRCLQSVKMVITTSALSGVLCYMISIINILRTPNRESGSLVVLGLDISVSLLSLFYAVVICILLLPLYFMLKEHIREGVESHEKDLISEK